jgi:putative ABC transport system permease protein
MIRLALRNIFRQKTRTAMTLAAIVFGIAGLILSGGFVRDIFFQLGEMLIHSQSGHLQIMRIGYYGAGSRSPEKYTIENVNTLYPLIHGIAEIDGVMARVNFSGLLNNGRSDWAIVGEGIEPDKESKMGSHLRILAGRHLTGKDQDGMMIGQGVAQALKLAPGDRVTVMLNTREGSLNTLDFEVIGVFQSFSKDFDARAVRIPLKQAHELLLNTGVNSLVISLKHTADTDRIATTLKSRLATLPVELKTWKEINDFYEKTVALYDRQFGVLQFIILFMVLLSVSNSVNMSIFERLGEFGTMRALGNRTSRVFRLILTESAMLGIVGSTLGIAFGIALALAISAIGIPMPPPPNSNLGYTAYIRIVPVVVITAFLVGVIATTLAALLPAARVTQTPVVNALRQNI